MWRSLICALPMLLVCGTAYAQVPGGGDGDGGGDITPPTAPQGLTATAVGTTQINLTWTGSVDNVGVTGYRLERCQGVNCTTFTLVATPTATNFSDTGRTPATTYRYQVRATDAAGNLSAFSLRVDATTQAVDTTPPTPPPGLTATAVSSSQINLSWPASTDNVGVTGYKVERCQGASCTTFAQVAAPSGTSFSDTGLAIATYRYRVQATDAAGNLGGYSVIASATTPDATPPTAPSGLTATVASTSQINLNWIASTDNVGVTGYRIERCQGANCSTFAQVAAPSGTTFADTGLAIATYSYRVRATDAAGNLSGYSTTVSATTLPVAALQVIFAILLSDQLTAPTGLTATALSASQINLGWTASAGATGYRVERCQGVGCTAFAQIATPSGTTFSDSGLTAATSYSYRVRAADVGGDLSGYSNVVSATTQPDTVPPTGPAGLTAAAVSATQINLSWTASTDNVGVAGYQVDRCQGAGCTTFAQVATPNGTSLNDTGLTPSKSYSYRVRATDTAGNIGANSNIATATTPPDTAPPTAPVGLTATAVSSSQINLTWSPPTDNVGVTGYQVDRCRGGGCSTFVRVTTSFNDSGLAPSTPYSYRVRATDAAGNVGPNSITVSATTQAGSPTGGVQAYYIHPDHLNTPRLIEDASETTVWRWDQGEPFGNDVPNNNPSGGGAFEFNLRFPGQYFDRETNLAYNYFRDFDPGIGRYIQSDPIGLREGVNTYLYVGGNPLSNSDPTGLLIAPALVVAIAGIAGGIAGATGSAIQGGTPTQMLQAAAVGFLGGVTGSLAIMTAGLGPIGSALLAGGIGGFVNIGGQIITTNSMNINICTAAGAFLGSSLGFGAVYAVGGTGAAATVSGAIVGNMGGTSIRATYPAAATNLCNLSCKPN